jgi:hypothetical protein
VVRRDAVVFGRPRAPLHPGRGTAPAGDAVLFTLQDPRTTRHLRVPATHDTDDSARNCGTRALTPSRPAAAPRRPVTGGCRHRRSLMLVVLGPVPGGLRRGPRQPSRLASARASVQLVHSAARLLGERQLSLPPGQGMSARSPLTRSAGCCGGGWYGPFGTLWPTVESPGVVDVVATPRVEAEF